MPAAPKIAPLHLAWKPNPEEVDAAFAQQRRVDPFGHRLHALFGALWCTLVCGPISVIEFGCIPLLLCFLIRYPRHQCTHTALKHMVAPWFVLAWCAWQGLSILWSLNPQLGLDEWGPVRFALPILLLWPVLDKRSWLIAGVAIGMLLANGAQAFHAAGRAFDIPQITFDRFPNRNSGWWQPVVGGTMLTAAVGLHLPAALTARGKWRIVGVLGVLVSIAGVAATGSRGAWLATAVLLVIGLLWFVHRLLGLGLRWGHVPLILAMLVVIGAIGYRTLWPGMRERALEGVHEVQRIVDSGDFSTYTGARILMAEWGARAVLAHPVHGIGAGSFQKWVAKEIERKGGDPAQNPAHAHCHNTFLHVAVTTGLIGLALFGTFVVLSLRGGFSGEGGGAGGYAAGPAFALLGMVLVSPFDVVNVNAQTAGLWWILIALCIWGRPKEVERVLPGVKTEDRSGTNGE